MILFSFFILPSTPQELLNILNSSAQVSSHVDYVSPLLNVTIRRLSDEISIDGEFCPDLVAKYTFHANSNTEFHLVFDTHSLPANIGDALILRNGVCYPISIFQSPPSHIQLSAESEALSPGALRVTYFDQLLFTDIAEVSDSTDLHFATDDTRMNPITYADQGMLIQGSFVVPRTGSYSFQLKFQPSAQFLFLGLVYPPDLPTSQLCSGKSATVIETRSVYLSSHLKYPFLIKMRLGCADYPKSLILKWKSDDQTEYEDIPPDAIFSNDESDCLPGFHGAECRERCRGCPGNSFCFDGKLGNGSCFCRTGHFGEYCNLLCDDHNPCSNGGTCVSGVCYCEDGFYGDHCERPCDSAQDCRGNGLCNNAGHCVCSSGYSGPNCDSNGPDEFQTGVRVSDYSNELIFDGLIGESVMQPATLSIVYGLNYGSSIVTGSIIVAHSENYSFRFSATPGGQFTINGMSVPEILPPARLCTDAPLIVETAFFPMTGHRYYPFSIQYRSGCDSLLQQISLEIRTNTSEYRPVELSELIPRESNGCDPLFSGEFCSIPCTDPCDHGRCVNGRCECDPDYYGDSCASFCRSDDTCHNSGLCSRNGSCLCADGYFGAFCNVTTSIWLNGYSQTCPAVASLSWFPNERFGMVGSVAESSDTFPIAVDAAADYLSLIASGSISPPVSGYYAFRAIGKPTVQIDIAGTVCEAGNLSLDTCETALSSTVSCNSRWFYQNQLVPFTIAYRSGCARSDRFVAFEYRTDGSGPWKPVDFLRGCNSFDCDRGYFGPNCDGECRDCGENGGCSDGRTGDGECICREWYTGSTCSFDAFLPVVISCGVCLILAIAAVCWPVNPAVRLRSSAEHTLREPVPSTPPREAPDALKENLVPGAGSKSDVDY
jgi:hypothetical protein